MIEPITIPPTVFGLLALIITTLSAVVVWQQKRLDKCIKKYDSLQEQRLDDLRTIVSKNTEVIQNNAQSNRLLIEKIDGVKRKL